MSRKKTDGENNMEIVVTEELKARSEYLNVFQVGETLNTLFSDRNIKDMTHIEIKEMNSEELFDRIVERSYFMLGTREECYRYVCLNIDNKDLWKDEELVMSHTLACEIALYFPKKCIHTLQRCKWNYPNLHYNEINSLLLDFAPVEFLRDIISSFLKDVQFSFSCSCSNVNIRKYHCVFEHAFVHRRLDIFNCLINNLHCETLPANLFFETLLCHEFSYAEVLMSRFGARNFDFDFFIRLKMNENTLDTEMEKIFESKECVDQLFRARTHELVPHLFENSKSKFVREKYATYLVDRETLQINIALGQFQFVLDMIKSKHVTLPLFSNICKINDSVEFLKLLIPFIMYETEENKANDYNYALRFALNTKKFQLSWYIYHVLLKGQLNENDFLLWIFTLHVNSS